MKRITFIALIICVGLLFRGLVIAADVKTGVVTKPKITGQPQPPVPVTTESLYSYNPVGKPDPFRPYVNEEVAATKKKEEKKKVTSIFPLQREETEKFRIVGIAGDKNRMVAIAEDATKKYYPLFIGTHIGTNRGSVVEILPDRVIVEEFPTKKAKRIILKLHKN